MTCAGAPDCLCGCCAGTSVAIPRGESNRAGLPAIAYRTGIWATFRESMLARLSSADYPALAPLKTRDTDDFSIALLDGSSVMLDILTFYQERLANESYLRTATQLFSLTQLSRLIGYQPSPGVAAAAYLAFTIKAATGLPTDPTTAAITIPAGTAVQSVPAQGQTPQTFETSAPILAKADWNALPVQTGFPWVPKVGATSVYLAGTATQLNPGDAILIVGDERAGDVTSSRWDVRIVTAVQPDNANARTLVTWSSGLGGGGVAPAQANPIFYALRQRASLFGYNAIDPLLLDRHTRYGLNEAGKLNATPDWIYANTNNAIDLDAVYSKLTPAGWLALIDPDGNTTRSPAGQIDLFGITGITATTRSDYGISGKLSRIAPDTTTGLTQYITDTRKTSVLTQSEALAAAEQPLDHPLYGTFLDLKIVRTDLAGITAVAVTGKAQKITIDKGVKNLVFIPDDGAHHVTLTQGNTFSLIQPPDLLEPTGAIPAWRDAQKKLVLYVADGNNRTGTITARLADFTLAPSATSDPVVQETALVASIAVIRAPFPHTRITLRNPLLYCYDRTLTTVNANVGAATAGSSVTELLGNGAAATPNQSFTLKQSPLTYVQATTPTGALSTLSVSANGVAWKAAPTLYQQPPNAQVFTTLNLPGGTATVTFGDNVEGATLPTGQSNVVANYRIGLGSAGNVGAAALTTLISRPFGVGSVTNPLPATGGQDAQSVSDIRANAPLSVLTLGRAVSVTDYQNFAASFAGIAQANAAWIPYGAYRGIFLTVAGAGGAALPPGNLTLANLLAALATYGDPNVPVRAASFLETTFRLTADILYDPAYVAATVQTAVLQQLTQTYSFTNRTFGQGVSADEIAALIQNVPGVTAVNVKRVQVTATSNAGDIGSANYSVSAYNTWLRGALPTPLPRHRSGANSICPYLPLATVNTAPSPAEILVLDPDPKKIILGSMT
jgi:hypothetical protein